MSAEVAGSGPRLPAVPGSPGRPDRGVLPALRPLSNTACPLPRTAQLRGQGRAWATLSVPSSCQQAEPPNSAPSHQPQAPPPPAEAAVQAILSRHFCPHHLCRSVGICPVTWQGAHAHRQHWDCSHLGHSGLPSLPCRPLPSDPPCRLSPKGHQEPRSQATRLGWGCPGLSVPVAVVLAPPPDSPPKPWDGVAFPAGICQLYKRMPNWPSIVPRDLAQHLRQLGTSLPAPAGSASTH